MIEQVMAGNDRDRDDAEAFQAGEQVHLRRVVDADDCKQRGERDEGDRREVLKEQNREA